MSKIAKWLLKAGTTDKRWGNKDNWATMGLKEQTPRTKDGKKHKR
jgi:hypothetical protein